MLSAKSHAGKQLVPTDPVMLFWFYALSCVVFILKLGEFMHFSFHESVDFSIEFVLGKLVHPTLR